MFTEANLKWVITRWNMQLGINQDSPFFPTQCHVLWFVLLSPSPVFSFLKCAH